MSKSESSSSLRAPFGLVCALEAELGSLRERAVGARRVLGLEVFEIAVGDQTLLAAIAGVGKVQAARSAAILLGEGVRSALFVVGTCGGLRQSLAPGTLVHCTRAAQTDFVRLEGRESDSDPRLRALWREVAPGPEGWFLTADRPVLSLWRRLRLARAFAGPCVADMETAAVAAVASAAGVPWAALRAVTDRSTEGGHWAFRSNFRSQAGRCADTVPLLLERLVREGAASSMGLPGRGRAG